MPLYSPPTGGGDESDEPTAGQFYARQTGGAVVSLTRNAGATNALVNINAVDGSYTPDAGGFVEFDMTTHTLHVLRDCALQVFIAPLWGTPGSGTGGTITFALASASAGRFYWQYDFDLVLNPILPYANGTPPIYPLMLFKAGDVITITVGLSGAGGAIETLNLRYIDLAVTAVAFDA